VKEMSFKSGVKDWRSDGWWEQRWWLWWGDMRRMRWTRRTVNRMRLMEWRRGWFHRYSDSYQMYCSTAFVFLFVFVFIHCLLVPLVSTHNTLLLCIISCHHSYILKILQWCLLFFKTHWWRQR